RKESETSASLKPPLDELTLRRQGLSVGGGVTEQKPSSPKPTAEASEIDHSQAHSAKLIGLAHLRQAPGLKGEDTTKLEPYVAPASSSPASSGLDPDVTHDAPLQDAQSALVKEIGLQEEPASAASNETGSQEEPSSAQSKETGSQEEPSTAASKE